MSPGQSVTSEETWRRAPEAGREPAPVGGEREHAPRRAGARGASLVGLQAAGGGLQAGLAQAEAAGVGVAAEGLRRLRIPNLLPSAC